MKRSTLVVFLFLLTAAAFSAQAQVVPAATGRRLIVNAGAEGSGFQPDYAGQGVAQAAPNRLYGIGSYIDADFSRWVQIEAEGRWLHWNEYADISENTYMIGLRVPIVERGRFLPYGKFLFGFSSGTFLTGRAPIYAYGGGLDYRLNRKFTLRAFDFEYQDWLVAPPLHPYGGSVGLSYRVF